VTKWKRCGGAALVQQMTEHSYRAGTRAARFLILREAIVAHSLGMRPIGPFIRELICGHYRILYTIPGAYRGQRFNLSIWPIVAPDRGHIIQGNKVANVDWDRFDNIDIWLYRSGQWEEELLSLLSPGQQKLFRWANQDGDRDRRNSQTEAERQVPNPPKGKRQSTESGSHHPSSGRFPI
jgi:hypothetical protein